MARQQTFTISVFSEKALIDNLIRVSMDMNDKIRLVNALREAGLYMDNPEKAGVRIHSTIPGEEE